MTAPQDTVSGELLPCAWRLWSEVRPTDTKAAYRWRVPERMICGMMLRPEWSGKLRLVGMGYDENEWWPGGSHWNGYVRTVANGLEWRFAEEGEVDPVYHGLELLPSPFTGRAPKVEPKTRYIGAAPYDVESFNLKSYLVTTYGWTDARAMQNAWNTRSTPSVDEEMLEALESCVRKLETCSLLHNNAGWAIEGLLEPYRAIIAKARAIASPAS